MINREKERKHVKRIHSGFYHSSRDEKRGERTKTQFLLLFL